MLTAASGFWNATIAIAIDFRQRDLIKLQKEPRQAPAVHMQRQYYAFTVLL